ncbi:ubiquitin-conjugating enzyme/RWD-like protein [Blyttiomyces helicus]|uniref:Ubiquitin-conjugating enzyme E2 Z n=1 Tax=Blyttiomyces helicus TaxID=388810 RepID=A0A4P9W2C9_9FUNG|nr:ubiquitin-conjugating enzyme/RWD-like protein [Blyttiomyces helicus]|eukprot:RKO84236.1 ubiquitin-conjugating enzyme/RWD-like protein [Blyttiomyces helicus]
MSDRTILRLQRELMDVQKNPETQIHIWYDETNIKHVHALIVGPPNTPYSLGFFDFVINFGDDYPTTAPKALALTTSNGRVRFNPNIYANGKVCLSILGTW